MKLAPHWISTATTVLTAILLISIFFLSNKHINITHEQNQSYYSVVWANDIFYKIDKAESELTTLNNETHYYYDLNFISNNKLIESQVFIILNQYSALGRALKQGIVDLEILKTLRKPFIEKTRGEFDLYLSQYRAQVNSIAWCDFEFLYTHVTNNIIYSTPTSCNY